MNKQESEVIEIIPDHQSRFSGADWCLRPDKMPYVQVIGLGNLGSWLSLFLNRMGYNLVLIDKDNLEPVNSSGQLYTNYNTNEHTLKTEGIVDILCDFGSAVPDFKILTGDYTEMDFISPIVISCVDSMKVRRDIYNKWKKQEDKKIFIEAGSSAEGFEIYGITPDREEWYEQVRINDEVEGTENCSYKATSHIGAMCSAYIAQILSNFTGTNPIRTVPKRLSYNGIMLITTTEV